MKVTTGYNLVDGAEKNNSPRIPKGHGVVINTS